MNKLNKINESNKLKLDHIRNLIHSLEKIELHLESKIQSHKLYIEQLQTSFKQTLEYHHETCKLFNS